MEFRLHQSPTHGKRLTFVVDRRDSVVASQINAEREGGRKEKRERKFRPQSEKGGQRRIAGVFHSNCRRDQAFATISFFSVIRRGNGKKRERESREHAHEETRAHSDGPTSSCHQSTKQPGDHHQSGGTTDRSNCDTHLDCRPFSFCFTRRARACHVVGVSP